MSSEKVSHFLNTSVIPIVELSTLAIETDTSDLSLFYKRYVEIHGYVSTFLCSFGLLLNFINIIVLTREHIRSATNCFLSVIALADMLGLCFYLIFSVYCYIITSPIILESQAWSEYLIAHVILGILLHNISTWLTVSMTIFQYISVSHPVKASVFCNYHRARVTIVIVCIVNLIACVPNVLVYGVHYSAEHNGFWVGQSEIARNNPAFDTSTFWIYGVGFKIVPSLALVILVPKIIYLMLDARKRRTDLAFVSSHRRHQDSSTCHRTTILLAVIASFTVLTDLPHGILLLISGLDEIFFDKVYSSLGEIIDDLSLLNSSVNFLLYCSMSRQFRDTFKSLFVCESKQLVRPTRTTIDMISLSDDNKI